MIAIVGLVLLIAAVVVGLAGVLTNMGSTHHLVHFTVLGYHVTGSTGRLFLYGLVVGMVGLLGLFLLLSAVRRSARAARAARRELKQALSETASVPQDRDDLLAQRQAAQDDTLDTRLTPYGRTQAAASPTRADDQAAANGDLP